MVTLQKFKNLIDLLSYFKEEQICRDYLELAERLTHKFTPEESQKLKCILIELRNDLEKVDDIDFNDALSMLVKKDV